jgi:hypothetical protein
MYSFSTAAAVSLESGKAPARAIRRVRRRHERERAGKQERKYNTKSFLQPQQSGLNLAVMGTPNANLRVMTFTIEPLESLQLIDFGAAALDFAPQGRVKLVHLAVKLCGEDSFLFGQLAIKL